MPGEKSEEARPRGGVLTDEHGNPSSMRWMAVGSFAVAAVLALLEPLGLASQPVNQDLILYFLIGAFGGKVGQKFAENLKAGK